MPSQMNRLAPADEGRPGPPPPRIPGVERLEPIGRGGYSVVYRGRQPDLDRDVAVKVLNAPVDPSGDADQWRREIAAMGRLSNHPNIVAAYAGGLTDDGRPYLVMPYVPEGTLGDRVRRSGPLAPTEVTGMGALLAGALAAAHEAGVLHRDVKPDNVLLSPYGHPQLTDFGIARLLDATTTMTRTIHATVAYAPPEVLLGRPATVAADVYGLGATLYACLAGAPPFPSTEHDNLISLVSRATTQPPPDLRPLGVPDSLAGVIEDALAKDPAERIPSAEDLRARLEAAASVMDRPADDTPPQPARVGPDALLAPRDEELTGIVPVAVRSKVGLPPPPQVRRVHRPVRRRPAIVAAAVVAGLLVLVAVASLVARSGGDDRDGSDARATATTAGTTPDPTGGSSEPAPAPAPPAASAAGGSTELASTAERYFEAVVAGDFGRSYDMLTPGFRAQQSRSSYEGFWSRAGGVEVVGEVEVDPEDGTAVVPVTIGGQRQDYPLRLSREDDGTWLVDGPRPGEG